MPPEFTASLSERAKMGAVDHGHLVDEITQRARNAANRMAELNSDVKDGVLRLSADRLEAVTDRLIDANAKDLEAGRQNGLAEPLLERLAALDVDPNITNRARKALAEIRRLDSGPQS